MTDSAFQRKFRTKILKTSGDGSYSRLHGRNDGHNTESQLRKNAFRVLKPPGSPASVHQLDSRIGEHAIKKNRECNNPIQSTMYRSVVPSEQGYSGNGVAFTEGRNHGVDTKSLKTRPGLGDLQRVLLTPEVDEMQSRYASIYSPSYNVTQHSIAYNDEIQSSYAAIHSPTFNTMQHILVYKEDHETKEELQKPCNEIVNFRMIKEPQDQLFYSKKHRHVEFKPCTTSEYLKSKPNKYYELGKLPVDFENDDFKKKKAQVDRAKDYAKNISKLNGIALSNRKPYKAEPKRAMSAREKALQFAKSVPRPRAKSSYSHNKNQSSTRSSPSLDPMDIMALEHERAKDEIAAIRREFRDF